ncbi:sporulation delaying protein family toxin [Mechercharimyces sp. CAU 1602]|uniref:sporulation delaying protein family toxin n=1 Tax=Mechercharimyces sp. CAU 1602 TaxID=2973933 RepID=UPI002161202F|nr:sporulation delaying protein family toxin [Mechercharimyces sp. CAU 1602]MCS1352294.1 sporulation delaying protein family toxin [Mechercharimyces sp. CAU 1602]
MNFYYLLIIKGEMNVTKKVVSWMLILSLLVVGVAATPSFAAPSLEKGAKYDGETIYRGLVFGQGPVAKLFPEIWTEELLAEMKKNDGNNVAVADDIMARMKEKDPKVFVNLEKAVYSGSHVKVNKALKKSGELLAQVIEQENGKAHQEIEGAGTGQCYVAILAAAITTVGAYSHAVVATAAGAVTIYAAVVVKTTFWTSAKSPKDAELMQEMLVNNVVTRLASN